MLHTVRLSQRSAWSVGQPISDLMKRALASPELISLAAGFVDQETLPVEATQTALDALMSDHAAARKALQYGTTPGLPSLREMLLARLQEADRLAGGETRRDVDHLVVTAGSNQLLHLVCEALLDPGDIVLCAAPTYLVMLGLLSNLGARVWGVAADHEGMIPEALEEALEQIDRAGELPRVKAIYVVSYSDNPRGTSMPLARRREVLDIAHRASQDTQIHVIEDAAYRDLRYDGEDIPSMLSLDERGDTVILAETFSKSYSPGVRVGWGVLPDHLLAPVCNQKGNIDFGSPNFSQQLMAKIIELDLLRKHINRIRAEYRRKLAAMLAAAEAELGMVPGVSWEHPDGGLYVWMDLPRHLDTGRDGELFDAAVDEGVLYVPGEFFYPQYGQAAAHNQLRLSFGVQSPDRIREGMAALGRAFRSQLL